MSSDTRSAHAALAPRPAPRPPSRSPPTTSLGDTQLRKNVRHATNVIQTKRGLVVDEMPDWQAASRSRQRQIKAHTLRAPRPLPRAVRAQLHRRRRHSPLGARRRRSPPASSSDLDQATAGSPEVIKIKSMTTEEIQLNHALEAAGIHAYETDLAELIIQLGHDQPSHIVVPALHKNRQQIREIFRREMNLPDLGETPADLADAARRFLREKFLRVKTGVSGANFLIAETGGVCVVESEGNGRMCLTLPETLITIAGIDKVIPRFQDLEVFLQLLPRSATGERMNPYNSIWTGVTPGDGPRSLPHHPAGQRPHRDPRRRRSAPDPRLHPLRRLPERLPRLPRRPAATPTAPSTPAPSAPSSRRSCRACTHAQSLPYASTLCGACYEVCPVKINIPEVLIHLRNKVVEQKSAGLNARQPRSARHGGHGHALPQRVAASAPPSAWAAWPKRRWSKRKARLDHLAARLLLGGWTQVRDLKEMPKQTFREWFEARPHPKPQSTPGAAAPLISRPITTSPSSPADASSSSPTRLSS